MTVSIPTCQHPSGTVEYDNWWAERHRQSIETVRVQWGLDAMRHNALVAKSHGHEWDHQNRRCHWCGVDPADYRWDCGQVDAGYKSRVPKCARTHNPKVDGGG